jgi:hypothetical protein
MRRQTFSRFEKVKTINDEFIRFSVFKGGIDALYQRQIRMDLRRRNNGLQAQKILSLYR